MAARRGRLLHADRRRRGRTRGDSEGARILRRLTRRRAIAACACALASAATGRASGQSANAALSTRRLTAAADFAALSGDGFFADGTEFRLIDVVAPGFSASGAEAHAAASAARLVAHLSAADFIVADVEAPDRWSRRRIEAAPVEQGADARSLAARLVDDGAVRVLPTSSDAVRIGDLLIREAAARGDRRGLWSLARYRVLSSDDAARQIGAFAIVEGVVLAAAKRGRLYLNFGEDYREDFTVTIPYEAQRRFRREGLAIDPEAFLGARLRVRGYLEWINGPSMEVTHAQAIEWL